MKKIFCLLISLYSLAAIGQSCCSFNSLSPTNSLSYPCYTSGGYTINVPGFTTTGSCTAILYYQLDGGGYVPVTTSATINIPMLNPGSHTIHFKLVCSDGTVIISSYIDAFTVSAPTITLQAKVCDAPSGSINKGCAKTFNIVDPGSSMCPNDNSILFPNMCGTTFQFMIYRSTTAPLTGAYPVSTAISGIPMYPTGPGTCSPSIAPNTWYRIPNDPDDPTNINLRSAPMPSTLPVNTMATEKYYVICYITNPCCFQSGYATVCPPFQILNPTTITPPAIVAFVCSPPTYPPTGYHQCCEKKFILRPACGGTNITNGSGFHYHWIILKNTTGIYHPPNCMAEVVNNFTVLDCPGTTISDNTWYKFGTGHTTETAPPLPVLPINYFYIVSCYIEIPCGFSKSSDFATAQIFKVLAPTAPTPVITWNDPSGLSTFTTSSSGVITVTRCIPPPANIIFTATGPPTSTTLYKWYDNVSGSNTLVQSGSSPIYTGSALNAPGTHTVYVVTTTTDPLTYPSPGCIVTSGKIKIIITTPPLPVISGPHIICTTNSNGTVYTLSRTGTGLQWFLNGANTGVTTSIINITIPGTYTVSSTVGGGCTATSAPFIVTGNPCNCHSCIFSNGAILIACDGNVGGVPRYKITFTLNNQSGCPGNFIISIPTIDGTLTATSTSTFFANTGTSSYTLYFTSTLGAGHVVHFDMIFTLLNGVTGSLHQCIEHHQITLPPGC